MLKPCPFCGEQIQSAAVKCRFCGEWLDPSRRPDAGPAPAAAEPGPGEPLREPVRADPPRDAWSPPPSPPRPEPWSPPPSALTPTPTSPPPPPSSAAADSSGAHIPRLTSTADSHPALAARPALDPAHGPAGLTSAHGPAGLTSPHGPAGLTSPHGPAGLTSSHLSVGTGVLAAGPLPPTPADLVPRADLAAPPRTAASRLADFERSFLDSTGDPGDSDGGGRDDDDPFTSQVAPQRPPTPWGLIGAVVGGVALIAVILFKNELFPPSVPPADTVADATTPPATPPPPTKEVKPDPPPETKLVDTKAPPVQPPPQPAGPVDKNFTDQLARARDAYSEGRLKAASSTLVELAKTAPDHPEVLLLTAQVQLEENKFAESQKTADRCVFVDPKLADCWLTLGVLRQNVHDNAGAVVAYETYLKLAPTGRYARDANSQLVRLRPRGAPTPAPAAPPATPAPSAAG